MQGNINVCEEITTNIIILNVGLLRVEDPMLIALVLNYLETKTEFICHGFKTLD